MTFSQNYKFAKFGPKTEMWTNFYEIWHSQSILNLQECKVYLFKVSNKKINQHKQIIKCFCRLCQTSTPPCQRNMQSRLMIRKKLVMITILLLMIIIIIVIEFITINNKNSFDNNRNEENTWSKSTRNTIEQRPWFGR